ncbi:MAG TPA: NAD-dependent epimerase/dehydratase family protein [Solirubrobacteraceae bacterium]|jgi:UDP-glucose 4-epimerase|nr:NAD-dependent epimerase/dehydratase family protein [Solirubrobacteraceae bacterium]
MPQQVIVTGGAGFIGSHLADALLAAGNEVTVIDDLSSGSAEKAPAGATLRELDIVDRDALDRVFDEVRPSAVYHLAAQASVTASVADPARDCAVNVQGTLNVVDAATKLGASVSFTSTGGALYGDDVPMPTDESNIPAPLAPYGASKLAGEAYVKTWSLSSGVPHAVCRLGNVYGPRQSPHGEAGVVAIFSEHLHTGKTPKMFGHGTPTRDYVHVADVVAALIAANGKRGTFNVATGVETDVLTLWNVLKAAAGSNVEPELAELRPGELKRSCLDTSHTASVLGWRAQVPVDQGLRDTYAALVEEFQRAAA